MAMDEAMMDAVCDLFGSAARRAQEAGFDMLELQMGHGYLLAQFLSPAVNTRTDAYGGSFEDRLRFPLRVLRAIREAASLPVIVRISAEEKIPGGITTEESIALVKRLESEGVAAVHVSAGSACLTPPWYFQHMFVPKGASWQMADAIARQTRLPVIAVGQINAPEDLPALQEQAAAYYAVGRALVADPDFVGKLLGEVTDPVRPCMACADGCLGGVKSGKGLGCVVNPDVATTLPPPRPATQKRYVVIGGGLAGMEAARTLARRGCRVDLYEGEALGGQFRLAPLPPKKGSLQRIIDYYSHELASLDVTVIQEQVSAERIPKEYDTALIATGARPIVPPIKGLERYHWADILKDTAIRDEHILIIGGGLIGIEVASALVDRDNRVTIVEIRGMEMIERTLTLKKLQQHGATILTGHRVTEVNGDMVLLEGDTSRIEGVDRIVVAAGMRSEQTLYTALRERMEVVALGDAHVVGKAQDAISEGYRVASEI